MSKVKEYKLIKESLLKQKKEGKKLNKKLYERYKELKAEFTTRLIEQKTGKKVSLTEDDKKEIPSEFKTRAEKAAKKYGFKIKEYKFSFNGKPMFLVDSWKVLVGNTIIAETFTVTEANKISAMLAKSTIEGLTEQVKISYKESDGAPIYEESLKKLGF